jgi:hypothetical protein
VPDPAAPLSGQTIQTYLQEVASELAADGEPHSLIIVGGSLLAWHGLRAATADVDSIRRLDDELIVAAAAVARRRGLAPRWLNGSAAAFIPATFDPAACEVLAEYPRLRVLAAPWDQVFVMKLYANRAQDRDDMVAIWPLTSFDTAVDAATLFQNAYPHAPDDEYLTSYVQAIADEAGH